MDHKTSPLNIRYLLIIAAVLQIVWGFVPTASQFVIDEIPVELYIAVRWTISGLIFAAFLSFMKRWKKIAIQDAAWISFFGILGYGVASVGTLYGLKMGGVVHFALVGAVGPIITSLVSIVMLKEKPHRIFYFALPISVAGLVLLALGKYQMSSVAIAGISVACILGACLLEAFVFVYSKKFKDKVSVFQYLAIAQISSASMMWLLQLFVFRQTDALASISWRGLSAALFVSIVACVLCYATLYWLLSHVDGHRLALFEGLHAVSATLFGFILLNESVKPLMLVGGFFILIGLVVGNLPRHLVEPNPE